MLSLLLLLALIASDVDAKPAPLYDSLDVDRDGRTDLATLVQGGRILLLGNEGAGKFADRTVALGLDAVPPTSRMRWRDVDGDGWTDLVVLTRVGSLELFRNLEGRGFAQETLFAGLHGEHAIDWQWLQLDEDARVDLLVQTERAAHVLLADETGRFERADSVELGSAPIGVQLDPPGGSVALAGSRWIEAPRDRDPRANGGTVRDSRSGARSFAGRDTADRGERSRREAGGGSETLNVSGVTRAPSAANGQLVVNCGAPALDDLATTNCVEASSVPLLGALYPLGIELSIDANGRVGMGTTAPTQARLEVTPDGAGDGIYVDTAVGGGTAIEAVSSSVSDGFAVRAQAFSPVGRAVRAINEATTGRALALDGVTRSVDGEAVSGIATSLTGPSVGVYGESFSTAGTGVRGSSNAGGGTGVEGISTSVSDGFGVRGEAHSPVGRAVRAINEATTGNAIGVEGVSRSDTGRAVFGIATETAGSATGVWGESASLNGTGVIGKAPHTGGAGTGVRGEASSAIGIGVGGSVGVPALYSAGVSGSNDTPFRPGVLGLGTGSNGVGMLGVFDPTGLLDGWFWANSGVSGSTNSANAPGVAGYSSAVTGTGYGVFGESFADQGTGVRGEGDFAGTAGFSTNGAGVRGESSSGVGVHGTDGVVSISVSGTGTSGSASAGPGTLGWSDATSTFGVGVLGVRDDGDLDFSYVAETAVSGTTDVSDSVGVAGWNTTTDGSGVLGGMGSIPSPIPQTHSAGVFGTSTGWGYGVLGQSSSSPAIVGYATHSSLPPSFDFVGRQGVIGVSESYGGIPGGSPGVLGLTVHPQHSGVVGRHAGLGTVAAPLAAGVTGVMEGHGSSPTNGIGVRGVHEQFGDGVRGESGDFGVGVRGVAGNLGVGVAGETGAGGFAVFAFGDFGGTGAKYFVHPHSEDPTKEIRYVALEGSEAGTYFRGTTRLVGGIAVVEVPEDFRLVSNEEGLSVHLTARSGPAALWVESESLERIVVAGKPDVEFHYLVQGVRRGYQDLDPIQENRAFVPRERGTPFGEQYPAEIRDSLVRNGILNPDYTPNEALATVMGWELRDPQPEIADAESLGIVVRQPSEGEDETGLRTEQAQAVRVEPDERRESPMRRKAR